MNKCKVEPYNGGSIWAANPSLWVQFFIKLTRTNSLFINSLQVLCTLLVVRAQHLDDIFSAEIGANIYLIHSQLWQLFQMFIFCIHEYTDYRGGVYILHQISQIDERFQPSWYPRKLRIGQDLYDNFSSIDIRFLQSQQTSSKYLHVRILRSN